MSNKVCVPNKTEDLNVHVFNTITEKNKSKILTKDMSCECKCNFDGRKYDSNYYLIEYRTKKHLLYFTSQISTQKHFILTI